jgi:hypothetical protein
MFERPWSVRALPCEWGGLALFKIVPALELAFTAGLKNIEIATFFVSLLC